MYIVGGFLFEDNKMAELAQKEEEGIRFIKERTDLEHPEVVYSLYQKLLEQNLFVTPVGQQFMVELQNILLASEHISKEDIPPIKILKPQVLEPEREIKQTVKTAEKESISKVDGKYKKPFYVALFFAIIFGISVVGMFLINELSANSASIVNYRDEIINEYAAWEAELKEKEAELKKKEKELKQREAELEEKNSMVITEDDETVPDNL